MDVTSYFARIDYSGPSALGGIFKTAQLIPDSSWQRQGALAAGKIPAL
jgi:hypothetical protein